MLDLKFWCLIFYLEIVGRKIWEVSVCSLEFSCSNLGMCIAGLGLIQIGFWEAFLIVLGISGCFKGSTPKKSEESLSFEMGI